MQSLAFEDQRHFVILLCLKCDGVLDRPLRESNRDRIIYRGLGLDPHAAEEAKNKLMEVGLIDKKWQPRSWDRLQFISDVSTQRTRKYKKTIEAGNGTGTATRRSGNGPDTDTDTDTDISTDKSVVGNAHAPPCPYQKIIDLYHEHCPTLPRFEILTTARKTQIRARWREDSDLDGWANYFMAVSRSPFLTGQVPGRNDKPFLADLEWLTKEANMAKVIEGKYHR